ncbi:NUDIX domain-containing protein [Chungangia koreensis]|uniref:NUDIX domain-containing protein n=1 Tax=Chungangia koreensis TaxID=752657 RepID=A0ABV8X521_9LACT
MLTKRKVLAYITKGEAEERELLVFEHKDIPEAGIQVPGGTIEEDELLIDALYREIEEETGITRNELTLVGKIRKYLFFPEGNHGIHERNIFHLSYIGEEKSYWEHVVNGGGEDDGLIYCLRWISLQNPPVLAGAQDDALDMI